MKVTLLVLLAGMVSACTIDTSCYDFWNGGEINFQPGTNGDEKCKK